MGHAPDWTRQNMKKGGAAPAKPHIRDMGSPFHGAKMQHFADGGEVEADAPAKAEGLRQSNAEYEAKSPMEKAKSSFSRLFQGNIDDPKSEAYRLYGAGRARANDGSSDRVEAQRLPARSAPEPTSSETLESMAPVRRYEDDLPTEADVPGAKPASVTPRASRRAEPEQKVLGPVKRERDYSSVPSSSSGPSGTRDAEDRKFTPATAKNPVAEQDNSMFGRATRAARQMIPGVALADAAKSAARKVTSIKGGPDLTYVPDDDMPSPYASAAEWAEYRARKSGNQYADGGMVRSSMEAPNAKVGTCGPGVRSRQDYKK